MILASINCYCLKLNVKAFEKNINDEKKIRLRRPELMWAKLDKTRVRKNMIQARKNRKENNVANPFVFLD